MLVAQRRTPELCERPEAPQRRTMDGALSLPAFSCQGQIKRCDPTLPKPLLRTTHGQIILSHSGHSDRSHCQAGRGYDQNMAEFGSGAPRGTDPGPEAGRGSPASPSTGPIADRACVLCGDKSRSFRATRRALLSARYPSSSIKPPSATPMPCDPSRGALRWARRQGEIQSAADSSTQNQRRARTRPWSALGSDRSISELESARRLGEPPYEVAARSFNDRLSERRSGARWHGTCSPGARVALPGQPD